jgi:hypothetical protein
MKSIDAPCLMDQAETMAFQEFTKLAQLASADRMRLSWSLLLMIIGCIAAREIDPNSFLLMGCFGLILIGCLPWLVLLRRGLYEKRYPEGGRWMKAARFLMWSSLLVFPITAGCLWVWNTISPIPDGFAGLGLSLLFLCCLAIAIYATGTFASLAFFIQLWRDQWHKRLNLAVLIYLCLFLISFLVLSEMQDRL